MLYEVVVNNRGAKPIQGVVLRVTHSDALKVLCADGPSTAYRIGDDRVDFQLLNQLPPGGETVYRLLTRTSHPGTGILHAEAHSLSTSVPSQVEVHLNVDPAGAPREPASARTSLTSPQNVQR